RVNGKKMTPGKVLKTLNALGGKHGIGRVDLVENRFVGMKSRGVYETPGGTILMQAHRQVESLTMDRDLMHLRDGLIPKYAELVYYGFWFAPEREALQALVDKSQEFVTGTVRLKLYKGNIITCGRKSKYSLYDENIASMEGVKSWYNQNDATGFIRLNGLRLRARALAQGGPWLDLPPTLLGILGAAALPRCGAFFGRKGTALDPPGYAARRRRFGRDKSCGFGLGCFLCFGCPCPRFPSCVG